MKAVSVICATAVFVSLMAIGFGCTQGDEPETVVVPVGEPGSGDPYDSGGDFGCETEGEAAALTLVPDSDEFDEQMVLMTFAGTQDVWIFLISLSEYQAVSKQLEQIWSPAEIAFFDRSDIDEMHHELCAAPEMRTEEGRRLAGILENVLGMKLEQLAEDACR